MDASILSHDIPIRLGCSFGVFSAMALWELAASRRALQQSKALRWTSYLGLTLLNSLAVRAIFPAAAVGAAEYGAVHGIGVFHLVAVPYPLAFALSLLVLDAAIYLQHRLFHSLPLLWRLHRVHHADLDFDVTTGARFHTIEILLSMLLKFAVVLVLGAPAPAVLLFEILLNATSLFNHGNVRLPPAIDRVLRRLVVTPDMH